MNWKSGLERLSAVWWGLWGVFFAGISLYLLIDDRARTINTFGGFAIAIVCVLAHRVSCWIIRGFFAPKT